MNKFSAVLSLGILFNAIPAHAAIVQGIATGTVWDSFDSNEFDGTYFLNAACSSPYVGSTATINFRIDTTLAPPDDNTYGVDPNAGYYTTETGNPYIPYPHTNWLQMSVTVAGQTIAVNGSSSSDVSLSDGTPSGALDMLTIRNGDAFAIDILNYEQNELRLDLWDDDTLGNLISGNSLSQSFLWTYAGGPSFTRNGALRISRGQSTSGSGYNSYDSAGLDIRFDSIQYSVVPVPPAIILFMSGLLGLAGFRKLL